MISADAELVRRAAGREPEAVAELLAVLRPAVVRYCRAKLAGGFIGGYATADDVAQETCLAVLKALPKYRDMGRPFAAFVYTLASNKVTDARRAAMRDRSRNVLDSVPEPADPEPGPEQRAIAADGSRRMNHLLERLTESQREIIVLRVGVGMSAMEVGEALGMTPAAVRMSQSRALAALRRFATVDSDEVTL